MSEPLISVIMGIYNCSSTLSQAIECILSQTYRSWELIMCDDGSSDDTYLVAQQYRDKFPDKIILLQNKENKGLNFTLNNCLNHAHGKYIARMDGDDLCSNDRLEKEIRFLENNPKYAIVSTGMSYFDTDGVFGSVNKDGEPQKTDIVKGTPFCHAPCMVRKEAYDAVNGYSVDKKLLRVEDYDLWIKMYSKGYRGYNIPEILYQMRDDRNAVKRRRLKYRLNEAYVKYKAVKMLDLPRYNLVYVLRPLIVGLIPLKLYEKLHKIRVN